MTIKINSSFTSAEVAYVVRTHLIRLSKAAMIEVRLSLVHLKSSHLSLTLMISVFFQPRNKKILPIGIGPKCLPFIVMALSMKETEKSQWSIKIENCISEDPETPKNNSIILTRTMISTIQTPL